LRSITLILGVADLVACSISITSHQLISLLVLGWKQSAQTLSRLFAWPVWTTCSSEEIIN